MKQKDKPKTGELSPSSRGEKIAAVIFVVMFVLVIAVWKPWQGSGSNPGGSADLIPREQDAYYSAQTIMERHLKTPRSAKWPPFSAVKSWRMDNGWQAINGHVDVDNAFGASMRTPFMITLSKTADGWKAETLILDGRTIFE